jgi:threonine/homoserine/homoserine lactone efflux protein
VNTLIVTPGAFVLYVIVATITPGPNNVMLMTVGLTKGHGPAFRAGLGVSSGWGFQVLLCSLGLGTAVGYVPGLSSAVEVLGIAYLLWLAFNLWRADELGGAAPLLSFTGAFFFQWVNPKALSMSLTTAGLFVVPATHGVPLASAAAVTLGCTLLCVPSTAAWALLGVFVQRYLSTASSVRTFNRVAAASLVATVLWLGLSQG